MKWLDQCGCCAETRRKGVHVKRQQGGPLVATALVQVRAAGSVDQGGNDGGGEDDEILPRV